MFVREIIISVLKKIVLFPLFPRYLTLYPFISSSEGDRVVYLLLYEINKSIRLGGKRGAGVPGYGVPECGKHGVWKTRGLVENTGSQWKTRSLSAKHRGTISLNFVISNCNEK